MQLNEMEAAVYKLNDGKMIPAVGLGTSTLVQDYNKLTLMAPSSQDIQVYQILCFCTSFTPFSFSFFFFLRAARNSLSASYLLTECAKFYSPLPI